LRVEGRLIDVSLHSCCGMNDHGDMLMTSPGMQGLTRSNANSRRSSKLPLLTLGIANPRLIQREIS
jgi:hypothetical protein